MNHDVPIATIIQTSISEKKMEYKRQHERCLR